MSKVPFQRLRCSSRAASRRSNARVLRKLEHVNLQTLCAEPSFERLYDGVVGVSRRLKSIFTSETLDLDIHLFAVAPSAPLPITAAARRSWHELLACYVAR